MNVRWVGLTFSAVLASAIAPVTAAAPEATPKPAAVSSDSGPADTLVNRILDRWYPVAGETKQDVALWRAQFGAILQRTSVPTLIAIDTVEPKAAGPNRSLSFLYQNVVATAVADIGAQMSKQLRAAGGAKLGSATTDLVFVGLTPCRVVDTRVVGLGISAGTQRNFYFYSDGTPNSWSSQGGDAGAASTACPNTVLSSAGGTLGNVPPAAALLNVTAVNTTAAGNWIAWGGSAGLIPNTSVLNWDHAGEIISNTTVVPWGGRSGGNLDFTVRYNGPSGFADLVVDAMGYFVENAATALDCTTAAASGPIDIGVGSDTTINYPACPSGYTRTGGYCNGGASTGTSGIYVVETGAAACVFRNLGGNTATGMAVSQCCRVPGR